VQGNGNFRVALRADVNTDNIVAYNEPPGGNLVPFDEWFHWAFTYDKTTEDPGEFVMYFNGEEVAAGPANGNVAGTELEIMGNWDQGAFIGLVPDFARQLVGRIDELYMFTRALPPEDITKLYTLEGGGVTGDFDADGALTLADINLLQSAVKAGTNEAAYDLNADNLVNLTDQGIWVHDLKKSWLGDANLDSEFNSGDLVSVFTVGKYETGQPANWEEGDWNADLIFDSGDFVAAFSDGGYEIGPHPAVAAVPEPATLLLTVLGFAALVAGRRAR
jgi:hypothetical protein